MARVQHEPSCLIILTIASLPFHFRLKFRRKHFGALQIRNSNLKAHERNHFYFSGFFYLRNLSLSKTTRRLLKVFLQQQFKNPKNNLSENFIHRLIVPDKRSKGILTIRMPRMRQLSNRQINRHCLSKTTTFDA